jgi:hypothetical protein
MNDVLSMQWLEQLKDRVNQDEAFRDAARWFNGTVGWIEGESGFGLEIGGGQVRKVGRGCEGARFTMSGSREHWKELMDLGTINRLFRQNKIAILGDKVEAMRFWKVLWYLTEIGRKM